MKLTKRSLIGWACAGMVASLSGAPFRLGGRYRGEDATPNREMGDAGPGKMTGATFPGGPEKW
jgi:hypothetical protein